MYSMNWFIYKVPNGMGPIAVQARTLKSSANRLERWAKIRSVEVGNALIQFDGKPFEAMMYAELALMKQGLSIQTVVSNI